MRGGIRRARLTTRLWIGRRTRKMASTEARVNVAVSGEVEFVVGEKTKAWLVSLGWTPPVEADDRDGSADLVEKVLQPSPGLEAAKVALNSREAERKVAQDIYNALAVAGLEPAAEK